MKFPFSGQLIDGKTAAEWLLLNVQGVTSPVFLCSAFLRSEALERLYPAGRPSFGGRILTRWRLEDLLGGASDLQAYPLAKQLGFTFFVRQDFHGKVFSIPDAGVIVGSANATLAGFGMKTLANAEVCTLVPASGGNQAHIDQIFQGSIEVTDRLFDEISVAVEQRLRSGEVKTEWPDELMRQLQRTEFSGRLLFSECLVSMPTLNAAGQFMNIDERDLQLLGLSVANLEHSSLRQAFKEAKIFRWLVHALKSSSGEMFFGALTDALHGVLLDDPVVYRREVKSVLQTLLHWCQMLEGVGIHIDRPNHSQRVRLV
jgi:hypothetical protein